MRCPQGGGLTAERRVFREHIRMQTAELFALGHDNAAVAKQLRVSPPSTPSSAATASRPPSAAPQLWKTCAIRTTTG
ncbi:hypothetical protein [Streptomyces sp. NPDC050704]|uniref:hypothetical protein n=1 Tax=Streptomyces sp. NPDC050704 TaxID=3157219 RepID=UPI00341EEE1C